MRSTCVYRLGALALLALVGCSKNESTPFIIGNQDSDPSSVEPRLVATLGDLAAIGPRSAGLPGAAQTAQYIAQRFEAAGLKAITTDPFDFPAFSEGASSLAITVGGAPVSMQYRVLPYSASATANADVVYVGAGKAADYVGKDVTGKIVLADRDPTTSRSARLSMAATKGGIALVEVSTSPMDLVQIGAVAAPEDGLAPIPAVAIGQTDGKGLEQALTSGKTVHAEVAVSAAIAPGIGNNVIGELRGTDPNIPYLLVGAHYDAWSAGAADNGSGVAALLEIAQSFADNTSVLGVVFVAYDAGDLGALGGYDYLRKHIVVGKETALAFIDLEVPAASMGTQCTLAHTSSSYMASALDDSGAPTFYPAYIGMETLPVSFGGIPGDAEGFYWSGVQGFSTACDAPFGETSGDTPDQVDTAFLAQATLDFETALDDLDLQDPTTFGVHDPNVGSIDATATPNADKSLTVDVTAKDGKGAALANASIRAWLDVDDFTRAFDQTILAGADGKASFVIPAASVAMGKGSRWAHVTAGASPIAEKVISIQ